jgi:hypothetical protein
MMLSFSIFNLFLYKIQILNTKIIYIYIKYNAKILFVNHPNTKKTLSHLAL